MVVLSSGAGAADPPFSLARAATARPDTTTARRAAGEHSGVRAAAWLTGLKVKDVAGFAGVVGGQPVDVEASAAVALRFDNGTFGTLTSGYYLDKGYHSHMQIWGEHGWLRLASIEEAPLEWYSTK